MYSIMELPNINSKHLIKLFVEQRYVADKVRDVVKG